MFQFFNAIYVIDGDKSNPSDIHIFDAASKSWSTQKTTAGSFDPTDATVILDHDTNVFCTFDFPPRTSTHHHS